MGQKNMSHGQACQFPQNVVPGVDLGLSAQNMTSIAECAIKFDSQI